MTDVPAIFISTPLKAEENDPDPMANVRFAREICLKVARAGGNPFAPHLYYPLFLDDAVETERNLGIKLGLLHLATSDESWVILPPWRAVLSRGMSQEKLAADQLAIPVQIVTDLHDLDAHLARLREGKVPIRASRPPVS